MSCLQIWKIEAVAKCAATLWGVRSVSVVSVVTNQSSIIICSCDVAKRQFLQSKSLGFQRPTSLLRASHPFCEQTRDLAPYTLCSQQQRNTHASNDGKLTFCQVYRHRRRDDHAIDGCPDYRQRKSQASQQEPNLRNSLSTAFPSCHILFAYQAPCPILGAHK